MHLSIQITVRRLHPCLLCFLQQLQGLCCTEQLQKMAERVVTAFLSAHRAACAETCSDSPYGSTALHAVLKCSAWLTVMQKTECEREDCLFSSVSAVLRLAEPLSSSA